jgi:hypothetical protein
MLMGIYEIQEHETARLLSVRTPRVASSALHRPSKKLADLGAAGKELTAALDYIVESVQRVL